MKDRSSGLIIWLTEKLGRIHSIHPFVRPSVRPFIHLIITLHRGEVLNSFKNHLLYKKLLCKDQEYLQFQS